LILDYAIVIKINKSIKYALSIDRYARKKKKVKSI